MRTENITILTGNSAGDLTGSVKNSDQIINLSVQVVSSAGTVAGVLKLQASNDAPNTSLRSEFTPTNYVDIPNATVTISAGGAGMIRLSDCSFGYIRAIWTHDGGGSTGTVTALMTAVGA